MLKAMKTCLLATIFLAAACGQSEDRRLSASRGPSGGPAPASEPASPTRPGSAPATLAGRLDCLRQSGGLLLIGHRGGPTRDYPENAIETLERTFRAGIRAAEIDIAQTKDGQLVLMHDDELDRTSTGTGLVSDHTLAELGKVKLKTYYTTTDFAVPTLRAALEWAVRTGAVLELDKKRSAAFAPIIKEVRQAGAESNVFIITYNDDQAVEVHKLAPDLVITATVRSLAHLEELLAKGVKGDRLVAWTGTAAPNEELWTVLAQRGVESAFGALGPRSSSLDSKYWEDGDGSEFNSLIANGLPILVSDLTDEASRQLAAPIAKAMSCGL